jgi:ABC-type antimicrobial peptide transport system permease subunit
MRYEKKRHVGSQVLAYVFSVTIILAAATFAAWILARRASRVDPVTVLGHD